MQGELNYEKIRLITEKNMRDLMEVTDNDDWRTEFPKYKADGTPDGTITKKGLQGLRDAIAQTIIDVFTNVTGTGSPTTASDGSGGSAGKSGDSSKVHIESAGDIEMKGSKTNIQAGNFEVT